MAQNKDLTDFREAVYIRIKKHQIKGSLGEATPSSILGDLMYARRTGSHTWQPFVAYPGGYWWNIQPCQVEEVYRESTHPEMFKEKHQEYGILIKQYQMRPVGTIYPLSKSVPGNDGIVYLEDHRILKVPKDSVVIITKESNPEYWL